MEIVPILQERAKWLHQGPLVNGDFYAGRWQEWKELVPSGCRVDVLTGGFACVTLSSAGKQLAQKDHRSRQLWDTMEMAIFFEVRAVLLENVVQLVDDDGDHHLLSQADEVALRFGYSWLATDCLFKNSGAAIKSRVVSTTNSNSIRSIKTAH